jgi:hypothetical protein
VPSSPITTTVYLHELLYPGVFCVIRNHSPSFSLLSSRLPSQYILHNLKLRTTLKPFENNIILFFFLPHNEFDGQERGISSIIPKKKKETPQTN